MYPTVSGNLQWSRMSTVAVSLGWLSVVHMTGSSEMSEFALMVRWLVL